MALAASLPRILSTVEDGRARRLISRIVPRILGGPGAGQVVARALHGLVEGGRHQEVFGFILNQLRDLLASREDALRNAIEIAACRPWLDAEIAAIRPNVIVCLGATAAQSLLGRDFRVTLHRGEFLKSDLAPHVMATVHPSSILRAPDEATRHEEMKLFIADLKKVAHHV